VLTPTWVHSTLMRRDLCWVLSLLTPHILTETLTPHTQPYTVNRDPYLVHQLAGLRPRAASPKVRSRRRFEEQQWRATW
jgi:hypothetical protein